LVNVHCGKTGLQKMVETVFAQKQTTVSSIGEKAG